METKWTRIASLSHMVSRASNNKAHNSPSVEKHCRPRSFQIPPTCFQACLKQPSNLQDASRWPRDASKIPTKMIQNASNSSQGIRKTCKTLKPSLKVCPRLSQTLPRSLEFFLLLGEPLVLQVGGLISKHGYCFHNSLQLSPMVITP